MAVLLILNLRDVEINNVSVSIGIIILCLALHSQPGCLFLFTYLDYKAFLLPLQTDSWILGICGRCMLLLSDGWRWGLSHFAKWLLWGGKFHGGPGFRGSSKWSGGLMRWKRAAMTYSLPKSFWLFSNTTEKVGVLGSRKTDWSNARHQGLTWQIFWSTYLMPIQFVVLSVVLRKKESKTYLKRRVMAASFLRR